MKKRRSAEQIMGLLRQAERGCVRVVGRPDIFPTLEMCPYPLLRILFTTPFVQGFPVLVDSPSVFKTSQIC